jgi:hypothetical protein
MAIIDEIERFEAGANRVRASAPSLAQRQEPVTRPAPRMVASRPQPIGTRLGADARALGSAAGALTRGVIANNLEGAQRLAQGATLAPRVGAGVARDFVRGVTGQPESPNAGQPLALPRLVPNLARRPAAAGAPATATPANPVNWSPGPRSRPRPMAPAASAAPAPAAVAMPSTEFKLQPGDVNTFTGADGVTKPVPGLLNASASPAAAPSPMVAARPVPLPAARGRQGAIIENPGDTTADKLQRALMSSSLKGSPSARAAVAQAILGEAGARQEERASALAAGDRADLSAVDNAARLASANADRDLSAQQTNAELVEQRADRAAQREDQRLARRPEVTVSADGSMGIVSNEGRFTPVTDAGGRTVRAPQAPRQTGAATEGELLKSYTDRYNAILGDVTADVDARKAAIDALNADPLYAGLPGRGGQTVQPGTVMDGYRFVGGDPANQANWEQVN